MKNYICGVVGAALVVSVISMLLPRDGICGRELKLISSTVMLCVIISPLAHSVEKLGEIFENGVILPEVTELRMSDALSDALEKQTASEIGELLRHELCLHFELSEDDVEVNVKVSAESGEVKIERIYVLLSGRAMWQEPHAVIEFVNELSGAPCEVASG